MAISRLCSIPDCGKPAINSRGWCVAHYKRWSRHGDPLAGRTPDGEARAFLTVATEYDGEDCLIWPYARVDNGYGRVNINGRSRVVSRVVCEIAHGKPPTPKHEAAHSCGKGHLGCVAGNHLSWKTARLNGLDKLKHGTHVWGERHPLAKLTEDKVRAIFKDPRSGQAIAKDYGISFVTVSDIKRRKSWPWLDLS